MNVLKKQADTNKWLNMQITTNCT